MQKDKRWGISTEQGFSTALNKIFWLSFSIWSLSHSIWVRVFFILDALTSISGAGAGHAGGRASAAGAGKLCGAGSSSGRGLARRAWVRMQESLIWVHLLLTCQTGTHLNFIFNFLLQSVSEIRWYDVLILLPTEGKEVFKWACQWVSQLVNVRPHSRTGGRREVVAWAWALFNSIDDYSLSTSYNSFKALSDFWFQFHFFFFFNDQSCWWILLNVEHYSSFAPSRMGKTQIYNTFSWDSIGGPRQVIQLITWCIQTLDFRFLSYLAVEILFSVFFI